MLAFNQIFQGMEKAAMLFDMKGCAYTVEQEGMNTRGGKHQESVAHWNK